VNSNSFTTITARNKLWDVPTNVARLLNDEGLIYWCDDCLEYHVNSCMETLDKYEIDEVNMLIRDYSNESS